VTASVGIAGGDAIRSDRDAQTLRGDRGSLGSGPGKQNGELLASDAERGVHLANGRCQCAADGREYGITGCMAMRVIDLLEVVHVDRHDDNGLAHAAKTSKPFTEEELRGLIRLVQDGHPGETAPESRPER